MHHTIEIIDLIKLLLAHIIGDFFIQANSWVKNKEEKKWKSPYLYLHAAFIALLSYIFIGKWNIFLLPASIFVIHTIIDIWKSTKQDNIIYFTVDQVLHLISIILISIFILDNQLLGKYFFSFYKNTTFWVLAISFITATVPIGILIQKITFSWQEKLYPNNTTDNSGRWVGYLERIAIIIFILVNHFEAIGFLIAAKSVFRYSEIKSQEDKSRAEYVLIGSLLSFLTACAIGLAALKIL